LSIAAVKVGWAKSPGTPQTIDPVQSRDAVDVLDAVGGLDQADEHRALVGRFEFISNRARTVAVMRDL
jgi:hypothetical protein